MGSELPLPLPEMAPGMTLPDFVLFPHATVTLYIFEPRYRKMLAHVLQRDHLILIATKDPGRMDDGSYYDPYYPCATLGRVQANKKNGDGTSTIVVHGLARVTAETTYQDDPFRIFSIRPQSSDLGGSSPELSKNTNRLIALIQRRAELGRPLSETLHKAFIQIDDPETIVDLAAHTLIDSTSLKLKLLETSVLTQRFQILFEYLIQEIRDLKIAAYLQGKLPDDLIRWN